MENSTTSAFPRGEDNLWYLNGLTKREWYAGLAMQSMIERWMGDDRVADCAKMAVKAADLLLEQLDKTDKVK